MVIRYARPKVLLGEKSTFILVVLMLVVVHCNLALVITKTSDYPGQEYGRDFAFG